MAINLDAVKKYTEAAADRAKSAQTSAGNKTTAKSTRPKKEWEGIDLGAIIRATGAPELEELGAVPDFTVDNSWQGSMDLGNADVNAGYNEFERQRGQLDTLQRYQEAAARNAQKAADYFDYAKDEDSARSFQKALELYQQATDRYNSAVGAYNTGVENFQKNPAVAKQQRQIAAVQRAQGKSYAELEQMITETADQMDQTADENARAQLQEQVDIYRAVQSQTEMTAADAAKRQGELERELATMPEARAQFVQTPAGWVKVDANANQAEYEENERRRGALERELRRMQGEEYTKTYEEEIASMPEGMRESIIAAGQAREQAAGAVKADALNMGRNGPELAAVAAQNNQTVATMTAALRGMGYDDATIDGMLTWGAQQANAERMAAAVENERAKAETRADRSGNYVKGDLLNLGEAVGSGLLGGAGYVDLLMQEASRMGKVDPLTGKKVPLDFSTDAMLPAAVQNAVNEAENSAIAKAMGERYGVDENGNLNAEAQRKANIRMNAFQIAESMGESAVTMLVGMAAGGTGGLAEKFGNAVSTLILASGAATQTAIDMHEQGFDDSTALIMGGIAGAAEYVTEKVSLESLEEIFGARSLEGLTKMGKARTFIGNILKQGFTEGSEEVASELINTVADYMLLGDWNQMERRTQEIVAEKQEQGIAVTEDAAKRQAIREMLSGVANSFISGAISGGLMGAAGSAVNTVFRNVSDIQTGRSITKSGNTDQVTQLVKAMDAETQKKLGLNKYNPESSRQVGRAARITVQQQMESAVRGRLAELGVDNPSDVLVAAVMDSAEDGVQLNKAEKAAIAGDGKALQVVEEMKSMGQYGGKSAAQLALEGFWNGTLNESNAWVIQALAEQEETERKITRTEQAFADRQAEGQTAAEREQPADEGKSYSRRASEIYADEEQRKAFERLYGPLEGSATENRAMIARTLRAVDRSQYSAEEETAGAVQNNAENVIESSENVQETSENVTEEETVERVRFGEEYHVRELMKDMTHAKANEIQRSPELKAAWESITGEKLSGNRKEAHDQLLNWTESEKTDIRDASERAYNETEDQITELAVNGRLEIPSDDGTMDLRLQESRRGGAVAAVTREGQRPVLFEGDTIEDAARQAVEYAKGERNGGQGTRAGGERAVGMGAEGSAESLAGEAGSDQSGTEQSRRIEKINAPGLQQRSAAAQGVANGTDTETAVSAEEIEHNRNTQQTSQEPLQDTGITDNRFTEALKKIGVNNITGSLVDYVGIEVEQQTARTAAEARRYLRRVLKETKADPRTQAFAHDVARGIYTMDDLPNTMSRGIVEELTDAYRFAEGVVQDSLAYKRRQINAGLDADARKLFADSDNYNPAKFGRLSKTLMNERTPARVLRSIFGEQKGSEIYEAYWRPIIENNAAAKLWKNKQREDVKTFRDSKGTIRELTVDESAYAMKVLEGLAFEEEARNAAGMDKENFDRYIANFNQLMELMPKTGYNTEADRVDDVLSGKLTRSEAAAQSTNKALFEQIMENRLATASLPELSRALQTTLDGYEAALQARQEIRENDTVDAEIIDTAARAYQQKYQDMYTAINQMLVAHGYEEIGFIKGYAPHMQPETAQNGFQRAMEAMGLTGNVSSLPASIAGQTANFKPNMRYNPHFQSRTGNSTEYDIAKGFQEYTNYLGDIIYHMDDIMRLRRAVNYFRTEYAGEGISERISQAQQMLSARTEDKIRFAEEHDLGYIPGMTDGQVADLIEKYIEDNYGETGKLTKYSEFTTWLENAANLLAGKQSLADRGLEYTGGRQMLNVANKLMTLFRQSKVAGSLSSALNQVAQLPAITTHLGAEYSARALSDIGSGEITDEWRERSAFLVGKMDEVKLRESGYEKFMSWMFTPSSFVDDTIATMAVRGEYLRQLDMGKSDYEAMRLADDYGRQVMGSRAKLEKPQAYESKRPVSQMIHMFQVEAVNSFDYIVSDLPVEIRNMAETQGKTKAATATAAAIVAYLLQAFLLNRLGEEIYGGTPIAFDLLGTTAQFFASGEGLTANEYLLEVIDNGLEDMGQERIFGTENNIGAQDFDTKAAFADVGRIAGDDIPLVRNMMAAVGWGDQTLPMINVANIGKGAKQIYEGAREGDLRYAVEGASNIAGEVAPGGGQIKKAVQGLSTVAFGGAYSGAGEERQLKYGVDRTARNWIKAGLFGRSALSQNEQYYAGKAKTLTAGQTDVWEMLVDEEGMEPEAAYKAVQKYRAIGNDKGLDTVERNKRERAVIAGLKISDGAKAEMWVDLTHGGDHTNERYQNIMRMMRMGAGWADVNTAFNEYDRLYHDENLSGTGKATEFAKFADEYAAHHGMSEYMVEAMKDTFGFSSGHRAEATAYEKLTGSDISTNHAGYIYELWSGLQPDPGKTTVSDVQKLYALGAASALSDEERYAAAGTLTDGEEYNEDGELTSYGKMLEAQRQGMPFADYTELRNEGAVDYYFKYRGAVQDNDVARDIAIGMKALNRETPEDETVQDWQRVNVICSATDDEDYQVAAMEELMEESEYFRFLQSNAHGITPKIWAEAMEKRPKFDSNYNGSYTQAEYTALVQSMPGLDKEQQAALWQMLAHGKRNPFDAAVGREIYDDYGVWSDAKKKREAAERKAKVEG